MRIRRGEALSLAEQIGRWMSLREPQRESLSRLHAIAESVEFKTASQAQIHAAAKERIGADLTFDTDFTSFCFALATGVGKTRLMGACIYDLWKTRGYRNFFILAPGSTIYEKLKKELEPSHPKYMFNGLADFPRPAVWDGDSYPRFDSERYLFDTDQHSNVFIFNIGKIFNPRESGESGRPQFKFHRFSETLGDSFSAILQRMDDLVVLMDESHRYRAPASLKAITDLKPVLGLEFTATPKFRENVLFSFGLGEAVGRFVKSPRVVTRTNLTAADREVIEQLKLKDGLFLHEEVKSRLAEFCSSYGYPPVKPFVLVSTRDITHAKEVREYLESTSFEGGVYQGKVIEIHSKPTGKEESDENINRLLEVESPTSSVEIVVHVTMLKEGWDVSNLYTIVPLRASVSEILTEQTIGRGLRLPLPFTESEVAEIQKSDPDILRLSIVSHDKYEEILAAKDLRADIFRDPVRDLSKEELEPLTTVTVPTLFSIETIEVLNRLAQGGEVRSSEELLSGDRRERLIEEILARSKELADAGGGSALSAPGGAAPLAQVSLFPTAEEAATPIDAERTARELRRRIEKEVDALALQIDVPDIRLYSNPRLFLEDFQPRPSSEFSAVEQRLRTADLMTGEQQTGEVLEAEEIDRPIAYLAGRLLDVIDEFGSTEDKTRVIKLATDYLGASGKSNEELQTLVHQYGNAMVQDLRQQIREHLHDDTDVSYEIRAGMVAFKPFTRSIREKDGEVDLRTAPAEKSQIKRYLFSGIAKSVINRTGFDSDPERRFAISLEDDPKVLKWLRPPLNQVPIDHRGERYTPDFLAETATHRYMIEIKDRGEIGTREVLEKAHAAIRWCEIATEAQDGKPWSYYLIPADAVSATSTLDHIRAQAVKISPVP